MVSYEVQVKRHLEGVQRGSTRLVESYLAQTVHPGELAAKNEAGYINGVNRNVKKWARNVATKRSLQELKNRMQSKGGAAYTASAPTANAAYASGARPWRDIIAQIKADVDARMPRGDRAQNAQRSAEYIRLMNEAAVRMEGM